MTTEVQDELAARWDEIGEVGVTAIGSNPDEAEALLERTVQLLAGSSAD